MKSAIFLLLIISNLFFAFTPDPPSPQIKEAYKAAERYFTQGEFGKALPFYQKILDDDRNSTDKLLWFEAGICFLYNSKVAEAVSCLKKAESLDSNGDFIALPYYLGRAYHLDHNFDQAILNYKLFLKESYLESELYKEETLSAKRLIEMCNNGKSLIKSPASVSITPFKPPINTSYGEFCPVLSKDGKTLFFSSTRNCGIGGLDPVTKDYNEDIYIGSKTGNSWEVINPGEPLNTPFNEAPLTLSEDGNTLFFYRAEGLAGSNIYFSEKKNGKWSEGVLMEATINDSYYLTGASISKDGSQFYFSSSRPGGKGGIDIYLSKKTKDGSWGKAVNLGSKINSPYNEEAPYLKGDTLFFASEGHSSMGGFDIFYSVNTDSGWTPPVNMGYPVNSADDEIYIAFSHNEAIFGTRTNAKFGREDLFLIKEDKQKQDSLIKTDKLVVNTVKPEEVIKEQKEQPAKKSSGLKKQPVPVVENTETKSDLASESGVTKEPNDALKSKGTEFVKARVHFSSGDGKYITEYSRAKLDALIKYLDQNSNLFIELKGYTDPMGTDEENLALSNERAATVKKYLVEKGISEERISANGFGATCLIKAKTVQENVVNRRVEVYLVEQ